ncbi:universal stress protein [Saccharomonospora xinjiangensis]|nr:universal stress protein [Saccharomonospora xinjiangensis]
MDPGLILIFAVVWAATGLATGLWMMRRGHDARWLVISVAMGPLFVPIALERVERRPRLAASGPGGIPAADPERLREPRVLIGVDGSPESEEALATALHLFGSKFETLVLAEVVSYDATGHEGRAADAAFDDAMGRLTATAARLGDAVPASFEVLAGAPGASLRRFAKEQDMDLLIVGRRGRGLARLLGSVSADVVAHSSVPVLVVGPVSTSMPKTETRDAPGQNQ